MILDPGYNLPILKTHLKIYLNNIVKDKVGNKGLKMLVRNFRKRFHNYQKCRMNFFLKF
jgi:uncharacterized protein (DUF362 family)